MAEITKTTETSQTPDLMAYLQAQYLNSLPDGEDALGHEHRGALNEFVEFCRTQLTTNQPVSMEYIDAGLAIRFQDSTVVPFVNTAIDKTMADNGPARAVSRTYSGQGMAPSRSFPITKGEKK